MSRELVGTRGSIVGGLIGICFLFGTGLLAGSAAAAGNPHFECATRPSTTSEAAPDPAILATLGVLRRPAVAADVPPLDPSISLGEGIYVKYSRLARTVAGTAYYLIPVAKGCASLGEEVVEESRGPGPFGGVGGETLAEIKQGTGLSIKVSNTGSTVWGVVPDGVATVVLTYVRPATHRTKRHRALKASVPVLNNVFVAKFSFITTHTVNAGVNPTTIVWRSAKGTVIRRIHPPA
jgi:hypothetical protein